MRKNKQHFLILIFLFIIIIVSCSGENKDKQKVDIDKSFSNFMNRQKYDHLNKDVLEKISDEQLQQVIIDYLTDHVIKNDYKNEYELITKQSKGFQYIWAIGGLEAEVNNGGFNQYFYNSAGQFAEEAYRGCIEIGANKTADIILGAINTLFKEIDLYKKTKATGTIKAFMASYKESQLDQWDNKFYKYEDDLSRLQIKYIRSHYEEFITK